MAASQGAHELSSGELSIDDDGVVFWRLNHGLRVTGDHVAEMDAARQALGGARPFLVDARGMLSADRAALKAGSGQVFTDHALALAVLANNPLTQMIVTFFMRVSKPRFPTKIFSNEDEARAWLLGHQKREAQQGLS